MRPIISLILLLSFAACATSNTIVHEPVRARIQANGVTLQYDNSTVGVPPEAERVLQAYMEERFFSGTPAPFRRGTGLTVRYRFIGYNEGNRTTRWLVGAMGGGGNAYMVIEAEFVGPEGEVLGRIQSQGTLGAGFFGGSHNSAIRAAATEVARYAQANFR